MWTSIWQRALVTLSLREWRGLSYLEEPTAVGSTQWNPLNRAQINPLNQAAFLPEAMQEHLYLPKPSGSAQPIPLPPFAAPF